MKINSMCFKIKNIICSCQLAPFLLPKVSLHSARFALRANHLQDMSQIVFYTYKSFEFCIGWYLKCTLRIGR